MSGGFSLDEVTLEDIDRCLVCASTDHSEILEGIDTLHGLPGRWSVRRCRACGHGFTSPRPDRDSISLYYPSDYSPFASPIAADDSHGWKAALKRIAGKVLDPREVAVPADQVPGDALEIGCGSGRFLVELGRRGWRVQGVEPSGTAIAGLASAHGVEVTQGTVDTVDFRPSSFDLVVGLMVLEHLHEPRSDVRRIESWIRPGGTFMGSVPNSASWEFGAFGADWYALQLPTHLSHFTPGSLSKLLVDAGFEPPKIIGQRNISNLMIQLGRALGRRGWPGSKLFLDYPVKGPRALRLAAWPVAALLAAVGQAGRMTFVARKPA